MGQVRSRLVDDSGVAGGVFASGFFVALCLCVRWFWLRPDFGPSRASGSSDELSRAEAALGENCVNQAGFGPERPRNRQKTGTSGVDRGLIAPRKHGVARAVQEEERLLWRLSGGARGRYGQPESADGRRGPQGASRSPKGAKSGGGVNLLWGRSYRIRTTRRAAGFSGLAVRRAQDKGLDALPLVVYYRKVADRRVARRFGSPFWRPRRKVKNFLNFPISALDVLRGLITIQNSTVNG
jgi:hypothetical protein